MKDSGITMNAEFHGSAVSVLSSDPLLGTFELAGSTGGTIEVLLDRYSAEALLSALTQFLAHDEDARASWLQ
ncbi:hypothetical protein MZK49_21560 [Ensifer sesbaniae]|jgi:hypothetical protein|uniref:hypothetical protein n=1 Tax=Ensifer sesbaniae TaxID=1214071 RepID=UPI0020019862|nr:hypothetical protein [Ensifer sesbaniae]